MKKRHPVPKITTPRAAAETLLGMIKNAPIVGSRRMKRKEEWLRRQRYRTKECSSIK